MGQSLSYTVSRRVRSEVRYTETEKDKSPEAKDWLDNLS